VLHGAAHAPALFFKDISKLAPIKYQIVHHRFMYHMFGFGSMHSSYAFSQKHASSFNIGHTIRIMRASEMHMAGTSWQCIVIFV
jgi:hypothetical protein